MRKLFEVPIYAMSEKSLYTQYEKSKKKFILEHRDTSEEILNMAVDTEFFPFRCWEYNHIVGMIVIGVEGKDIVFKKYRSYTGHIKYRWKSKVKKYLVNDMINGKRLDLSKNLNNEDIYIRIREMLSSIIAKEDAKLFADTRVFDFIGRHIDYKALIRSEVGNN